MINKDSLKARVNNLAKELNISQNVIYNRFFYDAFLSRLAVSSYKDKLILKGGLYLSSILGIDSRSTMDIDFYLNKMSVKKEAIINMIEEISSINIRDGIAFNVVDCSAIREKDLYGGFQVTLQAKLDNVKYRFEIDIATGDPIVPSEQNYVYKCLVTKEELPIKAYSLESVIAEKLETILSRGIVNSRSKDFYDLYILRTTQLVNIDHAALKEAFRQTCEYRKFQISKQDATNLLNSLSSNQQVNRRWTTYCKKVGYANDIVFEDAIKTIKQWIDICFN